MSDSNRPTALEKRTEALRDEWRKAPGEASFSEWLVARLEGVEGALEELPLALADDGSEMTIEPDGRIGETYPLWMEQMPHLTAWLIAKKAEKAPGESHG